MQRCMLKFPIYQKLVPNEISQSGAPSLSVLRTVLIFSSNSTISTCMAPNMHYNKSNRM